MTALEGIEKYKERKKTNPTIITIDMKKRIRAVARSHGDSSPSPDTAF